LKEWNLSAVYNEKANTVGKKQKLDWVNKAGDGEKVIHRQIKQTSHVKHCFCLVLFVVSAFIFASKGKGH